MRIEPRRLLFIIILINTVLLFAVIALKGWRLYVIADSLQTHRVEAEEMLAQGLYSLNPDDVGALVTDLRTDVVSLKRETSPFMFLTPYLGWVPKVGALIVESPDLLEIADAGTLAAETVFPALKPALGLLQSAETQEDTVSQIGEVLGNAQPSFQRIGGELERIETAYGQIENREGMPEQAQQFFPLIDAYLPLASDGLLASQLLPNLLGNDGRKTYLILVQNEDELRATGGFISGVGVLIMEKGSIVQMQFEDAYEVDNLNQLDLYDYPPKPFEEFMGLQYFLFRDSNFWVDFPTTAQNSAELYHLGRPDTAEFDGVLAIDQHFLELLVDAVGPIAVPDLGELTGGNVLTTIRSAYNDGEDTKDLGEWYKDRKAFIGVIAQEIQRTIFDDPTSIDPIKLLMAMTEAVDGRHLQLWMRSAESAQVVEALGWSGSVNFTPERDHLFIVDSNFGYNKANTLIERSFNYAVEIADDKNVTANVMIRHQHTGQVTSPDCVQLNPYAEQDRYQAYIDQCYFNYQRIITPANTQLLDATESPAPAEWFVSGIGWDGATRLSETTDNQVTFDRFLVVPRGQILDSELTYRLSPSVVNQLPDGTWQYKLTVYKQGGVGKEQVRIKVSVPAKATITSHLPSKASVANNEIEFSMVLKADAEFIVSYRYD